MYFGQRRDSLTWEKQAAAVAAYAACYELARYLSFSHWMLIAGLRMSCLLLLPRRFWPAIAVGETAPVIENALLCADQFGAIYAWFTATPIILLCMPVVALFRRHFRMYRHDGTVNMNLILACTSVCAVITAVVTDLAYIGALLHGAATDGTPVSLRPAGFVFCAYLLGAYLGALTLTPTVLALRERARYYGGRITLSAVWSSRLTREILFGLVPILAGAVVLAGHAQGAGLMATRLAMGIPVFVLTLRYGWHGGALGGMLASIALAMTSAVVRDPDMILAQMLFALALSGYLLFGLRVARRAAPVPASVRRGRVVRR